MIERSLEYGIATKVDRYLRREDSVVAKIVNGVNSSHGTQWRESSFKRGFELAIAAPVALMTTPVAVCLGAAAKLEDGGSMFFVHERVGKDGEPVRIIKIRAMKAGSDNPKLAIEISPKHEPEDDPRNTRLGKTMRVFEIEEFPQFLQVLKGDISLVDIRCLPQYAFDNIQENRPVTFEEWNTAYFAGKPGLLNLHSAVNKNRKNDLKRHHYDMLYARKASLGLDLFIIYRVALRMFKKMEEKIKIKRKPSQMFDIKGI